MNIKNLAPIVLFVYNRLWHTRQTVEALQRNELARESELFIYSDAPKHEEAKEKVKEVRDYIKNIDGFKKVTIIKREKNWGLANSVIDGVTKIVNEYGKIIVLEDDLVTSTNFLVYMNEALDFYIEDKKIWSISAYNLPIDIPKNYQKDVYLNYRASSWGWATWKDRWKKNDWEVQDYKKFVKNKILQKQFNRGGNDMTEMLINQMEGKIDSWAIRWGYSQFKDKSYCIYPTITKVQNIGMDGSGVHCGENNNHFDILDDGKIKTQFSKNLQENSKLLRTFKQQFEPSFKGKIAKILKKVGLYNLVKSTLK